LRNFAGAISTLAGSRGNLFATVSQLQLFTTALAHDNGGVRALNENLASVGTQLDNERTDLGTALANLSAALRDVDGFVAANRTELTSDLHGFTKVSADLQAEKTAITQVVDDAAPAVANLALAGDPKAKTLDTKANLTQPLTLTTLCQLLGTNSTLATLLGATLCSTPTTKTSAYHRRTGSALDLMAVNQ
jgi:phospholipid/cholesterol/gamma-HCH transport system substrate-binding protein